MERVKKSLGRLAIFSSLLLLIMLGTAAYVYIAASHMALTSKIRQKQVLGLVTSISAVKPSPTPSPSATPTPTPLPPTPTIIPTDQPSPTLIALADPTNDSTWEKLAQCESGGNWGDNTGNGYYGGLQFSLGAWQAVGGSGVPSDASQPEQVERGKMLQAARGWSPWGACSRELGL